MCDGDEDNKKWKQAVKEAKEEKDKKKNYSSRRDYRRNSPVRYGGRDNYGNRDRRPYGGRFGGSDGRYETRYGMAGGELVGVGFTGERTEGVTLVGRRDTSERTVESGRTQRDLEQAVASDPVEVGESIESSHDVKVVETTMS